MVHRLRLIPSGAGWAGDLPLEGRRLSDGVLQVVLDGTAHRVPVLRDGEAVQVMLPEGEWTLRLLDPYAPPGGEAAGAVIGSNLAHGGGREGGAIIGGVAGAAGGSAIARGTVHCDSE